MLKAATMEEINNIPIPELKSYLAKKATEMMEEYHLDSLVDIGCFIVLDESEAPMFREGEMEYAETVTIGEVTYRHGVRILGDSYGEDIFLPIEVNAV